MKGELVLKAEKKADAENAVVPVEQSKDGGKLPHDKVDDTLVFLEDRRKRRVDVTVDTPERYVSRYHYDTKNLAKYLELCPHCRKPTLYTYRQTVVDSAINYLEEKELQRGRHVNRSMFVGLTAAFLLASAGLYYLMFHLLSGGRV